MQEDNLFCIQIVILGALWQDTHLIQLYHLFYLYHLLLQLAGVRASAPLKSHSCY